MSINNNIPHVHGIAGDGGGCKRVGSGEVSHDCATFAKVPVGDRESRPINNKYYFLEYWRTQVDSWYFSGEKKWVESRGQGGRSGEKSEKERGRERGCRIEYRFTLGGSFELPRWIISINTHASPHGEGKGREAAGP